MQTGREYNNANSKNSSIKINRETAKQQQKLNPEIVPMLNHGQLLTILEVGFHLTSADLGCANCLTVTAHGHARPL